MLQPYVLVVEDSYLIADATCGVLAGEGYRVGMAKSAAEAISLAEENKPDLAIIDLELRDGKTGAEVGRHLRARGCAVLVCTGLPSHLAQRIAEDVGAAGALVKPASADQLLYAVKAALGGPR